MPFLITSNENIFLKTQGAKLGVFVAPNIGLEWALLPSKVSRWIFEVLSLSETDDSVCKAHLTGSRFS